MSRPHFARLGQIADALRRRPRIAAGALAALALAEVMIRDQAGAVELLLVSVLAVATTAPVGWFAGHWWAPVTVAAAVFLTLLTGHHLPIAGLVAMVITFYVVARHKSGRTVALLVAPLVILALVELAAGSGAVSTSEAVTIETGETQRLPPAADEADIEEGVDPYPVLIAALAATTAVVGYSQRSRRTEARLENVETAYTNEVNAHAARGERVRIARELHDVVAHRITSIAVQAETARLTTSDLPPESARHLTAIGDSARDALAEMRQLLGVLRRDATDATERHPQPGIADIHQLIEDTRRASSGTVRLALSGTIQPLDPGLELTAYRVVQESLTNAQRHAPGAAVDVKLEFRDDLVCVRVRDTGGYPSDEYLKKDLRSSGARDGHGLIGMRERVEIAGGRLKAGPARTGGFFVEATLPHRHAERPTTLPEGDDEH